MSSNDDSHATQRRDPPPRTPERAPYEHRNFDLFEPFKASIRNHLGEFADEWMGAKIGLVRKLKARIEVETSDERLKELRKELHDALLSNEDVTMLDGSVKKLLEAAKGWKQELTAIYKAGMKD